MSNPQQQKPQEVFTTPVGRLVSGSLYQGETHNDRNVQYVYKSGPDQGKPYLKYSFGIAIPKDKEVSLPYGELNWTQTEWGAKLVRMGAAQRADCLQMGDKFSWKVKDGDSTIPNSKGRIPNQNVGWPGHWILFFTSNQKEGATAACGLFTLIGQPNGRPLSISTPDTIMPGDFIQVNGVAEPNGETDKPGIYLNARMVCHMGYHPEGRIVTGAPDPTTAGFGAGAMPSNMVSVPAGGMATPPASPPTSAPAVPASPPVPPTAPATPPAPPVPPTPPSPNPAILQPPVPPVPPAPPAKQMTAKAIAEGLTYDMLKGGGWSDEQMIQGGYLVA